MRRSAVISARKFHSPVFGASTPESTNASINLNGTNTTGKLGVQKTARSTSSILNILNKEVTTTDVVSTTPDELPVVSESKENQPVNSSRIIYNVVWSKKTTKKHKTWEGDGTVEIISRCAILKDLDGKELGRANQFKHEVLEEGSIHFIGSKEVQVMDLIVNVPNETNKRKRDEPDSPGSKRKSSKTTVLNNYLGSRMLKKSKSKFSLAFQPLVLPTPPPEHQWAHNTSKKPVVHVSLDSCLARVLRAHQRTGLVFLYECVMGFRHPDFYGAILADEMGLGKTLQCVSLIWTLLKQGPYGGAPVIRRVLIVTPSSLTSNWKKEFLNWLGRERIDVFVIDNKNKPKDFTRTNQSIMVISYEMCLRYSEDVHSIPFDLLLCDEGHRLKNSNIKLSTMLSRLDCRRRVILSGTPIQNDLQEFFALIDFVNPGVLGSAMEYRWHYEEPIKASREPHVPDEVRQLGEERAAELNAKSSQFVLRRTQELLDGYLPTKTECVVFCWSSPLQQELYGAAVDHWASREVSPTGVMHLSVMVALRKVCNHPRLLQETADGEECLVRRLRAMIPPQEQLSVEDSGKLKVLDELLHDVRTRNEKVVVVSYFQQTLDLIEGLCACNSYSHCRLDGSTASARRARIVEKFNAAQSSTFVFLLSAKAGGVGLNLVGASRLVLYDSDWNPATDLQAMSRIWRDGQKRSVYLYRLLTAGTIEEKMFQRQISKTGLSGAVVDPSNPSSIRLSDEELKDLFGLQLDEACSTHASLDCDCACNGDVPCPLQVQEASEEDQRSCQLGAQADDPAQSLRMHQLMQWEHHGQPVSASALCDLGLRGAADRISFMFLNKSSL